MTNRIYPIHQGAYATWEHHQSDMARHGIRNVYAIRTRFWGYFWARCSTVLRTLIAQHNARR